MCIREAGQNQEQARNELFCGSIKSFNSRRGFGFVSCEETALRFGRDVYLSKDEAVMLAAEPAVGLTATDAAATPGNDKTPPVQEGDVLLFQVKLSTEGFPQAVQARKLRRLRGIVQEAPSAIADGIIIVNGDGSDQAEAISRNPDAALKQLIGAEVRLRQAECGQLQLMPHDEVAFCCVSMAETDGQALEAQLVELLCTSRGVGSVLGCFSLTLPQLGSMQPSEDFSKDVPSVEIYGHALTDCVFLSEIPLDLSEPDLMRLFNKLGGKEARVIAGESNDRLSASISFSGPEHVAKFLVQATHTISENGITQLAHVGPCIHRRCGGGICPCASRLAPGSMESDAELLNAQNNVSNFKVCHDGLSWPGSPKAAPHRARTVHTDHQVMQTPSRAICRPSIVLEASIPVPDATAFLQVPQVQNSVCSAEQGFFAPTIAATSTSPTWRCVHNNIVIPTAVPEILVASENCCSVCIQWPTVIHATAYVVELLDQGTMTAQRFVRGMPAGTLPALIDLRVEGLQPSAYAASVRCVAPCGCESASSPWSFLALAPFPPPVTPAFQMLLPNESPPFHAASLCPPPPSAPPALPVSATMPTAPPVLPPIPEETHDTMGSYNEEILTLD